MSFPILTVLIVLPAAGALLTILMPNNRPEYARTVGYAVSVATFAIAVYLLYDFDRADAGYQFVSSHAWMEPLGVRWTVGVDGISLFMVALTALLIPIGLLASANISRAKSFIAWMLLLEAGLIGVFLALDLILFFIFFEVVLVPMYFLIAGWGHENRRYAATKFFLFTMAGSAFLFVGILAGRVPAPQLRGLPDVRHAGPHPMGVEQRRALVGDVQVVVHGLRDRVRRQDSVVPAPHVVARRAHRHADGRLGDPGRRAPEDGHVRVPALGGADVPAGRRRPRAVAARRRGDRHHLRSDRRRDATQPETSRRLLVGRAPRVRRAGDLRAHAAEHPGWTVHDALARSHDGRAVPLGRHALRAPAHVRDRAVQRSVEGHPGASAASSSSRRSRRSGCPASRASSANSSPCSAGSSRVAGMWSSRPPA